MEKMDVLVSISISALAVVACAWRSSRFRPCWVSEFCTRSFEILFPWPHAILQRHNSPGYIDTRVLCVGLEPSDDCWHLRYLRLGVRNPLAQAFELLLEPNLIAQRRHFPAQQFFPSLRLGISCNGDLIA
jgi:hypothetical protein